MSSAAQQRGSPAMKYALAYGILSGLVIITVIIAGTQLAAQASFLGSVWFGYLVMFAALTFLFVGVKRYRDVDRGGVIGFGAAFAMGLGIAVVAGLAYVVVWEAYLAVTNYAFMDQYIAGVQQAREAQGLSPTALAKEMADLERLRVQYRNPLFRVPMTFLEIFPVGLIVALASALLLRNPKARPAAR
jgi:uncharacterized membrane protein YhaH (DUF805 family)